MPPTFRSLSQRKPLSETQTPLNICLYGQEGTGKTSDALYMANFGRTLVVNAEANVHKTALDSLGIKTDNIIQWPDPDEAITYESLQNVYFELKADLIKDPASWFGVTLDSVTEIIRILISNSRHKEVDRRKGTDKARTSEYKEEWDDFNIAKTQMELLRNFRSLPLHMAFTALESRDKEGIMSPMANPAMMEHLPGFASILVHCVLIDEGDENLIYAGYTQAHGDRLSYRGKDSLGKLPRRLPNPTFTRIYEYSQGILTKENDPILAELRERARARKATTETTQPDKKEAK